MKLCNIIVAITKIVFCNHCTSVVNNASIKFSKRNVNVLY